MSNEQSVHLESLVSDMGVNALIARHYLGLKTQESQMELSELIIQQLAMAHEDWCLYVGSLGGTLSEAAVPRQASIDAERLVTEMEVDALKARDILRVTGPRLLALATQLRQCISRSHEGWSLLRDQVAAS